MRMWVIAIPLVCVVVFCVYQYVLLPKMKANQERKLADAAHDFARQIVGKEAETKQQFIQHNENIKPIAFQIGESEIIGIISCQEKREARDFLRQVAVNMAGKALERLRGVSVKEVDNTEHYFLALTTDHLHYLHYSQAGECKEHLSFDRSRINNIQVGKVTSADMLKNQAFAGLTERLSFESGDNQYKFFFYDKMYAHPSATNDSLEEIAKVNHLFAKPFLEFVQAI